MPTDFASLPWMLTIQRYPWTMMTMRSCQKSWTRSAHAAECLAEWEPRWPGLSETVRPAGPCRRRRRRRVTAVSSRAQTKSRLGPTSIKQEAAHKAGDRELPPITTRARLRGRLCLTTEAGNGGRGMVVVVVVKDTSYAPHEWQGALPLITGALSSLHPVSLSLTAALIPGLSLSLTAASPVSH